MDIKTEVHESLNNALDSGYDEIVFGDTALCLAYDLCAYNSELEDEKPGSLVPFIEEWRIWKATD